YQYIHKRWSNLEFHINDRRNAHNERVQPKKIKHQVHANDCTYPVVNESRQPKICNTQPKHKQAESNSKNRQNKQLQPNKTDLLSLALNRSSEPGNSLGSVSSLGLGKPSKRGSTGGRNILGYMDRIFDLREDVVEVEDNDDELFVRAGASNGFSAAA